MKCTTVIIISATLLFLLSTISFPQNFTKITEGVVVTDDGDSWGCSWGDFDNDGYLDLFVSNHDGINFLYRNNGNGTFTKIMEGDITSDGGSLGSTSGDFDNDGDLDLFVPNIGEPFFLNPDFSLYINNGDAHFSKSTFDERLGATSCSWGDFDNDGYLDLFVGTAFENNLLYENNGDSTFTKITEGSIVQEKFRARGCSWADFDNDTNLDLFIANRDGNNFLYRNSSGGSFSKITEDPVVDDSYASYSGSWGDYDNDGDLDLFVTNLDTNNFLYSNNGDGTFIRVTDGAIFNDSSLSFGSSWGDFDNDGDLDLFVSNNQETIAGENNSLYSNNGDGTFTKITEGDVVNDTSTSAGSCWVDYDNDGDLDLFVANFNNQSTHENNFLYQNNGNSNHWVNIKCVGTVSNRSAIGARVRVKALIRGQPVWQMREISGQTGFGAQNSLNAEFGLGDATEIDSIEVIWPASHIVDRFADVSVNQFLEVVEGEGITSVRRPETRPEQFELFQNYPNPFNPSTTISYFMPHPGFIILRIYDVLGREVKVLFNGVQTAGRHKIIFDAGTLPSGIYFYELRVTPSSASYGEPSIQTKKMLYLR